MILGNNLVGNRSCEEAGGMDPTLIKKRGKLKIIPRTKEATSFL